MPKKLASSLVLKILVKELHNLNGLYKAVAHNGGAFVKICDIAHGINFFFLPRG